MSVTIDANVLIYASNEDDPRYERARNLLIRLAAGAELVHLFWPTLLAYLRIATHPTILPEPQTFAKAAANISELINWPNVRVMGELPGFWQHFSSVAGPNTRGNIVSDTHLVALMRQHGVAAIYSWDRDFRRFEGISLLEPPE